MIVHLIHQFLKTFYSRHLFERLVCYVFVTELFVKVFFELVQGQWFYIQSQNKQYLFYALIVLDYLFTLPRVMHLKVRFNYMAVFLLIFTVMITQGVFVGIYNHNRPFEIFNDTIPLIVLVLNALRMQSYAEGTQPIDFMRLLRFCGVTGSLICIAGQLALLLGLPSQANVGAMTAGIYFPLFFAALMLGVRLTFRDFLMFGIIFVLSVINMNRTTLAFICLAMVYYIVRVALRDPTKGVILVVMTVFTLSLGWSLLPEDSGTYSRIMALTELDLSETSGSIGERRNEMLSIERDLANRGLTAEMLGRGHGGLYEVQFTHEYLKDYGHAHYSWALFNLRYGMSGYIYLSILALTLLYHAWRNWRMWNPMALTIAFMCVQSFMYMGTYVNFVLLLAGLQFLYLPREPFKAASGLAAVQRV